MKVIFFIFWIFSFLFWLVYAVKAFVEMRHDGDDALYCIMKMTIAFCLMILFNSLMKMF